MLKCPADIIYEKEWRASYGNRCNAIFLSEMMCDGDSVRKMIHNTGDTHAKYPIIQALWKYYQNHNKQELLDTVERVTENCTDHRGSIYVDFDSKGKRILCDWNSGSGTNKFESFWANLAYYERRSTETIYDCWSSGKYVFYKSKSVADVLRETAEKTTFVHENLKPRTGNRQLDLLVCNVLHNPTKILQSPAYYKALTLINADLIDAFERQKPLAKDAYMPVIIALDGISNELFNRMDYKMQRVFHKSDLGQEILKFSYLTTQNLLSKYENSALPIELCFDEKNMNDYLSDIKNTDLWQVAQRKIAKQIITQMAHRLRVGSQMNNRILELSVPKAKPKESMYGDYWRADIARASYINLYV